MEIVIAPSFSDEALAILTKKKNIRLLTLDFAAPDVKEKTLVSVNGGLLVQEADKYTLEDAEWNVVTKREPTEAEREQLRFAWKVVKHVKSNAIVLAKMG